MNNLRYWGIAAVWLACCALLAGAMAACATDDASIAAPTAVSAPITPMPNAPSVVDTPTATVAPTPSLAPTALPTPIAYDSNRAMYKVFPGFGRTGNRTYEALAEVRMNGDISLVAALVESMRFQSTANAREATADVLRALTGEAYGGEDWKQWMEWLGRHSAEYPPPDGYLDWKINLLSEISPRFRRFLAPARDGAIAVDPTELVWGGVLPDGIPDIRNPTMLTPDEAAFLAPDERVFGVAINGDARAYPLRIANAHEMVNDVVGGEPIALSW